MAKRPTTTRRKVRTRSTEGSAASRTAKKRTAKSGATSKVQVRGAQGFAVGEKKRAAQEAEYERTKERPFDFKLSPGEEAEVILLDNGDPFFTTLHKVPKKSSSGKTYWTDEVCIADSGERCPLCDSTGKKGSYTLILSCLDKRPYTTRDGKVVKISKRLFKVKGRNLPKFKRLYEKYEENPALFRGLKVLCRRDGDKESATGEDLTFGARVKETVLAKYKELSKIPNYEKAFSIPTPAQLREWYSVESPDVAGSEEFGGSGNDDNFGMEDVGW